MLTDLDFLIMQAIQNGYKTHTLLVDHLKRDPGQISRYLKKLSKKEFIEYNRDDDNWKIKNFSITDLGVIKMKVKA